MHCHQGSVNDVTDTRSDRYNGRKGVTARGASRCNGQNGREEQESADESFPSSSAYSSSISGNDSDVEPSLNDKYGRNRGHNDAADKQLSNDQKRTKLARRRNTRWSIQCYPLNTAAWLCLFCVCCFLLFFFAYIMVTKAESETLPSVASIPSSRIYNSSKANSIVDAICAAWHQRQYEGDFCSILCKRNWTLADYAKGGAKHVLKIHHDGKDLILKMQHPFAENYDQQIDFNSVDEEEFTDKVLDFVNDHLHLDWPRRYKLHLLRKIWPQYRPNRTLSTAEKRSVWALLQQDEFINVAILPMSRVTPKLLGVCGHAYRTEYLIPFRMKPYYLNLKAKILVHLMGTLKLFHEFLNEPFQWCDVKFENLGLSADYPKRFVVMDSDMLYTESKLNEILRAQKCKNDSDCGLFDCQSKCNTLSGHCTGRTNDNVDVFCKKLVVQQLFGSFWSKSNRYLAACHSEEPVNATKRLNELRLVWAWTLSDV